MEETSRDHNPDNVGIRPPTHPAIHSNPRTNATTHKLDVSGVPVWISYGVQELRVVRCFSGPPIFVNACSGGCCLGGRRVSREKTWGRLCLFSGVWNVS